MAASNPTNEAELLALLVADLREVCKANGLSHVGKKKKVELQDRIRAHLFAAAGGGASAAGGSVAGASAGSGGGGASVGSGGGSPRGGGHTRTPAEQVAFSCDVEVEELVLKTLPDQADKRMHSVVGGWLAEAFCKMTGKEVTKEQLCRAKFTFTGAGGEKRSSPCECLENRRIIAR